MGMNANEIARSPKLRTDSFVGEANAPNLRDILYVRRSLPSLAPRHQSILGQVPWCVLTLRQLHSHAPPA